MTESMHGVYNRTTFGPPLPIADSFKPYLDLTVAGLHKIVSGPHQLSDSLIAYGELPISTRARFEREFIPKANLSANDEERFRNSALYRASGNISETPAPSAWDVHPMSDYVRLVNTYGDEILDIRNASLSMSSTGWIAQNAKVNSHTLWESAGKMELNPLLFSSMLVESYWESDLTTEAAVFAISRYPKVLWKQGYSDATAHIQNIFEWNDEYSLNEDGEGYDSPEWFAYYLLFLEGDISMDFKNAFTTKVFETVATFLDSEVTFDIAAPYILAGCYDASIVKSYVQHGIPADMIGALK